MASTRGINLSVKVVVIVLVVASLGLFAVTYKVRFNEAAVQTWFGKAGENSTKLDPGLYWKMPYPFSTVTKYDTRWRFLGLPIEQVPTADRRPLTVEAYVVWRVADPAKFFRTYNNAGPEAEDHFEKAEETLRTALRSSLGELSEFQFNELFSPRAEDSRLPELETAILSAVRTGVEGSDALSDLGIEARAVGINAVELPGTTTQTVFERMKEDQTREVKALESRGESEAQAIRSRAEADAENIRSFARARAEAIRGEGDKQAAVWLSQISDQDLAAFLQQIELMRSAIGSRVTAVLTMQELLGLGADEGFTLWTGQGTTRVAESPRSDLPRQGGAIEAGPERADPRAAEEADDE